MIKIAVCDDNKNDREIIKQFCKEYFNENNIKYELKEYISGQEFLEKNDNTDVLLLDEEMEHIKRTCCFMIDEKFSWSKDLRKRSYDQ